jgi:sugar transferase EpsL
MPPGVPFSKRLLDLTASAFGLLVLSPFLVLIAAAVLAFMGRPALYRQVRPGYKGRPFTTYKFRTMKDSRGPDGRLLPDGERLTAFGRWLRSTSLDDLPQLVNVLRGEMSLVGPRPLLMQYLERYNPEQMRRHDVLPGITGWAQVNGRNALDWEARFRLDVWYVDNWSFGLDLRILWKTILPVLRRQGISQPGQATADEFMGPAGKKG